MHHDRFDYSPIIDRPPLELPHGARVAVWIIPNIEYFEFDGPGIGIAPPPGFPDILNYAWRDYGTRIGVWRLMELFDRFGLRATVALNAKVCEFYPRIIEEGLKRKWEFMGHGMTNSQMLAGMPEVEERKVIRTTVETITKAVGRPPRGWLGPALAETVCTPDLLAEHGIAYLCDWCNDDQPYPFRVKTGRLVSLPYANEINDIPFFIGKGATPDHFREAIQDCFDVLYEEGKRSARVMAIALHPFLAGVPHRQRALAQALEHIKQHDRVWFATGSEIADWYYQNYYK